VNTIVIIHFQPLELYPPIQNLLRLLEAQHFPARISIVTTATTLPVTAYKSGTIKILRFGIVNQRANGLMRYLNYARFYTSAIAHLIANGPKAILYYETLSSFPAWFYKKFIKRNVSLFIHYHEYTEPKRYAEGMVLERIFHTLEMSLYPGAQWVSHTNQHRLDRFKQDLSPVTVSNPHVMPNYPPKRWLATPSTTQARPLKVVYIGALSLQTMYVSEFATWVLQQNGNVLWDIYSYNNSPEIVQYISQLNTSWISLKAGVDYDQLPSILKQYQVGVVLYKGHIPNYVYNAPNKLFEYNVCGLDTWFADVMIGSMPYATEGIYPCIKAIDFTRLKFLTLDDLLNRNGMTYGQKTFSSEAAYNDISQLLNKYAS
jgi:hypothetical protein